MSTTIINPYQVRKHPTMAIKLVNTDGDVLMIDMFDFDRILRLAQYGLEHSNAAGIRHSGIEEEVIDTLIDFVGEW